MEITLDQVRECINASIRDKVKVKRLEWVQEEYPAIKYICSILTADLPGDDYDCMLPIDRALCKKYNIWIDCNSPFHFIVTHQTYNK